MIRCTFASGDEKVWVTMIATDMARGTWSQLQGTFFYPETLINWTDVFLPFERKLHLKRYLELSFRILELSFPKIGVLFGTFFSSCSSISLEIWHPGIWRNQISGAARWGLWKVHEAGGSPCFEPWFFHVTSHVTWQCCHHGKTPWFSLSDISKSGIREHVNFARKLWKNSLRSKLTCLLN